MSFSNEKNKLCSFSDIYNKQLKLAHFNNMKNEINTSRKQKIPFEKIDISVEAKSVQYHSERP